jgi:sodium/hydrogen antiporter
MMELLASDHGLNTATIAVVSGCFLLWVLVSARLERFNITAPTAFVVMGLVVSHGPLQIVHLNPHSSTLRSLAEVTLAVVLFADASRVNLRALRRDVGLPLRLLAIGLPLTIGVGTAIAFGIIPGIGLWVAATIAAIVAPTDAALGATIMEDRRVPARIRRLLNVESGLNDGIATPFVNLFLAGAVATEVAHQTNALGAARELLVGAGVGFGAGVVGGWLLHWATQRGWSGAGFRPLAALALALFSYAASIEAGGNGFVAAFVAGMAFGSLVGGDAASTMSFTEDTGELLSLLVWLTFGAVMVVPGFQHATWQDYLVAVLVLTVARMLPVAIATLGSGLDRATVAFVGWFGPRGLASVVFGLIAFDSLAQPEAGRVLSVVTVTVTFSVIAHGFSASPLAARYGGRGATTAPDGRPTDLVPHPVRVRSMAGNRLARRSPGPTP